MESIIAATAGVAKLFMQENELGKIQPGFYADCILVDGNPLEDISVLQDHDKLKMIMINGRIHKVSSKDLTRPVAVSDVVSPNITPMRNFVAYANPNGKACVGHLDLNTSKITPMVMQSGAPLDNLYQVIELESNAIPAVGDSFDLASVKLLPPISGRDVLCVGKNYSAHAKEFNKSGYDSSDKIEQPSHPVIFTKRATSIVASGDPISPHPQYTQTLDYEGEIGVIIGKGGHGIDEDRAMDHVWGYTIINDVTARERQRDHKQFYMGKSPDTFCPIGPIAVPAAQLPQILHVETRVNGQLRQSGSTEDLIFSIPKLINTLSAAITLQSGDIIATGTPAGVGFGQDPPSFLKPGDKIEISVTGLSKLINTIAEPMKSELPRITTPSAIPMHNLTISANGEGLTKVGSKLINVQVVGSGQVPIVYIHGLGGTTEFYRPLLQAANLHTNTSYKHILYDLEGHGHTPTSASSSVTMSTLVEDLYGIVTHAEIIKPDTPVTLVAHSLGGLIALNFALDHPKLVHNLVLIGPGPSPLPEAASKATYARAAAVRAKGMLASGVAEAVCQNALSAKTKAEKPLAVAIARGSLLSQEPEGYAKGCMALAGTAGQKLEIEKIRVPTMVIAGEEDKISTVAWSREMEGRMKDCKVGLLKGVGHWHCFEDLDGVAGAVKSFL